MIRRRMLFGKKSRLPAEYQEVEYIESHGTEYIDTALIPRQDLSFDCTFQCNNVNGNYPGYGNIFGSRRGSSVDEYQLTMYTSGTVSVGRRNSNYRFNDANKHSVSYNGLDYVYIDGSKQAIITRALTNNNYSIALFGLNQAGTFTQLEKSKIYYCKLGNEREFIPCYRKSDGVIGMYDLKNSICSLTNTPFYINGGTGNFDKGENVN